MSGPNDEKKPAPRPSVAFNPQAEELVLDRTSGHLVFRPLNLDGARREPVLTGLSASRSVPSQPSTAEVLLAPQFSAQSTHPSIPSGMVPSVASSMAPADSSEPSTYAILQREYGQTDLNVNGRSALVLVDPDLGIGKDTVEMGCQTSETGFHNPPGRKSYVVRKSLALPGPADDEDDTEEDPYAHEIPLIPAQQATGTETQVERVPSLQDIIQELNAEFQTVRGSLAGVTAKLEKYLEIHMKRLSLFDTSNKNPRSE